MVIRVWPCSRSGRTSSRGSARLTDTPGFSATTAFFLRCRVAEYRDPGAKQRVHRDCLRRKERCASCSKHVAWPTPVLASSTNNHDVLYKLQRQKLVPVQLRIEHRTKSESILAIADIVAGARTDHLCAAPDEPHALTASTTSTTSNWPEKRRGPGTTNSGHSGADADEASDGR